MGSRSAFFHGLSCRCFPCCSRSVLFLWWLLYLVKQLLLTAPWYLLMSKCFPSLLSPRIKPQQRMSLKMSLGSFVSVLTNQSYRCESILLLLFTHAKRQTIIKVKASVKSMGCEAPGVDLVSMCHPLLTTTVHTPSNKFILYSSPFWYRRGLFCTIISFLRTTPISTKGFHVFFSPALFKFFTKIVRASSFTCTTALFLPLFSHEKDLFIAEKTGRKEKYS